MFSNIHQLNISQSFISNYYLYIPNSWLSSTFSFHPLICLLTLKRGRVRPASLRGYSGSSANSDYLRLGCLDRKIQSSYFWASVNPARTLGAIKKLFWSMYSFAVVFVFSTIFSYCIYNYATLILLNSSSFLMSHTTSSPPTFSPSLYWTPRYTEQKAPDSWHSV